MYKAILANNYNGIFYSVGPGDSAGVAARVYAEDWNKRKLSYRDCFPTLMHRRANNGSWIVIWEEERLPSEWGETSL